MKKIIAIAMMAAAAFSATTANAEPEPEAKAKVFVNAYMEPNYAIVSAIPNEGDVIVGMEVTNESGSVVYANKRVADAKSAQYLLNIARLSDGVYTVNFEFRKGATVSKTFIVEDNTVVR